MKALFALCFFILMPSLAFADPAAVCATMPTPEQRIACLETLVRVYQEAQRTHPSIETERDRELMRDLARQQALGLMMFGTGPALLDGMNRGLERIEVEPYQLPMPAR